MHKLQKRYEKEIEELTRVSQRLGELGFVASHGGNLSYKAGKDHILITPTKVVKRKMQFTDIVVLTAEGEAAYCAEGRKPTGETPMHLRIYEKRPDLNGLVHAHPPVLTGFSLSGGEILSRPLLPEPVIEIGPILLSPYAEPISKELAEQFDKIVGRSNAWLMQNHGITIGSSEGIERALDLLEMAEALAVSIHTAQQSGSINEIPRQEVEKLEKTIATRNMKIPGDPRVIKKLTELFYS